ncbi:MAG: hypothetical protein Q8O46_00980 [bacterium]|nr:hypothetical protein [bacterium]
MDEVEELGAFIEVEKMIATDDISDSDVLRELQSSIFSLGVSPEDEVKKSYDIMMIEKCLTRRDNFLNN